MNEKNYDLDNISTDIGLLLTTINNAHNSMTIRAKDKTTVEMWEEYDRIRALLVEICPEKFSDLRLVELPEPDNSNSYTPNIYFHSHLKPLLQESNRLFSYFNSYRKSKRNKSINTLDILELLGLRFPKMVRQLSERYAERVPLTIEDEYDFQYLFQALLSIYFDDIRPEEWTPSYASGCSRVDFLLKNEKTFVELKKTRKNLAAKEVKEQLIIDIANYKTHQDCKTLFCVVYDPENRIKNPAAIESDLSKNDDDFQVIVRIYPKN